MIKVENLSYRYGPGLPLVLDEVNLEVKKGESLLICGDSGSGKSTLLHCINGIIPHLFGGELRGEVSVNNQDNTPYPLYKSPRQIGMVFQNYEEQIFMPRVKEDIAFGLCNAGFAKDKAGQVASITLEEFGIAALADFEVERLSAGQKQRLAIAGVYALKPQVMLFDEPLMNLDCKAKNNFIELLGKLKEKNVTLIVTESDACEIKHLFDRLLILQDGKLNLPEAEDAKIKIDRKKIKKTGLEILKLDGVSFKYDSGDYVLDGINISFKKGECAAIIGDNGSGKTTLLKLIPGIIKPNKGKIGAFGITNYSVDQIIGKIGLLFQNPDEQLFTSTVRDEIYFGASLLKKDFDINRYLEKYSLTRYKDNHPQSLSKGERQRVAFLSILSTDPEIIILDEPTTGLDRANWHKLMEDAKDAAESGKTVIFSTHNMDVVDEYADRVIRLERGKINLT